MAELDAPPRRRDAVRNLERVLTSAGELLDQYGDDLTMEMIARHAGVGVGTIYRRFPNKDALLEELARAISESMLAAGRADLARADGTGLRDFLRTVGHTMVRHRGHAGLLVGRGSAAERARNLEALLADLLADAQLHGQAAAEVAVGDLMTIIWALRGVIESTADVAPDAWMRHLDLHLAALRDHVPSTDTRPALSARQLERISEIQRPRR
ncbi:TetR/AcrR family transcriptional regulator [Pseudofrankia asymbiotica]|uniref:TetR/AcrR family transcriptional regulator n=1 Tax=Pseudofrankia asymbiotica TaxID=1834516 RepID=UPI0013044D69|nr:TetR/AcrR family transcriptional regulator [Pseudofrankia asymbiotica]